MSQDFRNEKIIGRPSAFQRISSSLPRKNCFGATFSPLLVTPLMTLGFSEQAQPKRLFTHYKPSTYSCPPMRPFLDADRGSDEPIWLFLSDTKALEEGLWELLEYGLTAQNRCRSHFFYRVGRQLWQQVVTPSLLNNTIVHNQSEVAELAGNHRR